MPPCPAPPASVVDSDEATIPKFNGNKEPPSIIPPKKQGVVMNSLHWEMNVITFSILGLVYASIPEDYKQYMHFVFGLIILDASRYYYLKGSMAGVPYTLPLVTVFAMIVFPVPFWTEMAVIAMESEEGMCTNQLVGKFLVFCTDPKVCREIMTGEGTYGIYAHPNAKWLFGAKNLIYLDKEPHKAVRKILSPALFNNEALHQYAECQENVIRRYMAKYAKKCKETNEPIDLRIAFRSMAAAASQESFLGPYLNDDLREHLEQDILLFTMGFLCPPITFLGGLKTAIQAKNRIEKTVRELVPVARKYVEDGNAPRCLLERWFVSILEAAKELGVDPHKVPCCEDDDIARCVLDFLFAAQDATNSGLTYAADVLATRPDIMDKMRNEVESLLGKGGADAWEHIHDSEELSYTCKVANQLLHHKPPVPMIPHLSKKESFLGGHNMPAGAVLIPSLFYAARVSGSSTEYIPERPDADSQFVKCMTFGAGQHKCPGRRYAESLMCVFMAVVATDYRFERIGKRPGADDFIYFPTLFPAENTFMVVARE